MAKNRDTRSLLAAVLLGEQTREEAAKESASPLDIAIAQHEVRHQRFCMKWSGE